MQSWRRKVYLFKADLVNEEDATSLCWCRRREAHRRRRKVNALEEEKAEYSFLL